MRAWFANIASAIDILKGRLPGALAMLKANDVSVTIRSRGNAENCVEIVYYFDSDRKAAGDAYRACERLYEMNRTLTGDR